MPLCWRSAVNMLYLTPVVSLHCRWTTIRTHLSLWILLIIFLASVGSDLRVIPYNAVVPVGENFELRCNSTNDDQIEWRCKCNRPPYLEDDITHRGQPINGYSTKYESRREPNGIFVLKLIDAGLSESGDYVCVDQGGFGTKAYAHVEVITELKNRLPEVPGDPTVISNHHHIVKKTEPRADDQTVIFVCIGLGVGVGVSAVMVLAVCLVLRWKQRDNRATADDGRIVTKLPLMVERNTSTIATEPHKGVDEHSSSRCAGLGSV